jgi:hypothetical protein
MYYRYGPQCSLVLKPILIVSEQDSTHRLEKGLELGSALDEHVAGPAAPEIRYEPAEVITDPLLYTQGHNARARIYSNINDKTQRLDPRESIASASKLMR